MMEKKKRYQLVAWTSKINDKKESVLLMTPSLHHEMQALYYEAISRYRSGAMTAGKIRKLMSAYEKNIAFLILTGYYSDAIRMCIWAAKACFGINHSEFFRMYGKFHEMTVKYDRKYLLLEKESRELERLYDKVTEMEDARKKHMAEIKAWKRHC